MESKAGVGGTNTGGAVTTGGSKTTGGATSTGGSRPTGGTANTGGSVATGGTVATGGAAGTGGSTGTNAACPGADATEFALVQAWLNNTTATGALPNYAYSNIKTNFPAGSAFNTLACSIAMSCVEFAPTLEANWLRQCEAVVTSAIVAESSYNPNEVVTDTYATRSVNGTTADDPTVGLLQIRFSSTVHDYNYYGPMAKITAIGCNWPSALTSLSSSDNAWATEGGTTYLSFMEQVPCNIALAAWYYFYNATANGGATNSNVVYIANYCAGQGIAGNMLYGLDSHLDGGGGITRSGTAGTLTWSNLASGSGDLDYPWGIECCACGNPSGCTCTGCTGRFAAFMGIGTSAAHPSPDPFVQTLAPEPTTYCK